MLIVDVIGVDYSCKRVFRIPRRARLEKLEQALTGDSVNLERVHSVILRTAPQKNVSPFSHSGYESLFFRILGSVNCHVGFCCATTTKKCHGMTKTDVCHGGAESFHPDSKVLAVDLEER